MASFDKVLVHNQLHVANGPLTPECLGRGPFNIRGGSYLQGPVQFGDDKAFHKDVPPPIQVPKPEGSVMIGPLKNEDSPLPQICEKIEFTNNWEIKPCGVKGIGAEKYGKKLAHPYSLVVRSGTHKTKDIKCQQPPDAPVVETKSEASAIYIGDVDITGYTRINDRISIGSTADFYDDVIIREDIICGGNQYLGKNLCVDLNINAGLNIYADLNIESGKDTISGRNVLAKGNVVSNDGGHVLSAKKNFDIPHPSKKGWRLTHTCLEGPEASVYFRGRITNSTEIDLPSYWKDLVDVSTITVTLTPIGSHQDIIIKGWSESKVHLQTKGGMPIDCFYYIMAERKDTEKLIPEYRGTIEDYPGDNSQRSIAGYHYDTKEKING